MDTKIGDDMYKIEKDVPLTVKTFKYPFLTKMEVGDSVVVPKNDFIQNTLYITAKRLGIKVSRRRETADTVRIWRTA